MLGEKFARFDIWGSRLKLIIASVSFVGVILCLYLVLSRNAPAKPGEQAFNNATSVCVCPRDGTTTPQTPGLDCEETNCPVCGTAMGQASLVAATQNALPRPDPVPRPLTQNEIETQAERGLNPVFPGQLAAVQPSAAAIGPGNCVCPNCGQRLNHTAGVSCSQIPCPNCGTPLTATIVVGANLQAAGNFPQAGNFLGGGGFQAPQGNAFGYGGNFPQAGNTFGGMGNVPNAGNFAVGGNLPNAGNFVPGGNFPNAGNFIPGGNSPTAATNYSGAGNFQGTVNFPPAGNYFGGGANLQQGMTDPRLAGFQAGQGAVTYTNSIQGIVQRNCMRCHGGQLRNLSTYEALKPYADSGLLLMMVQAGGPMSHFVSPQEASAISSWVKAGAPP